MKILPDLREAEHRHADAAGKHIEGDEFADRKLAIDNELRPEIENRRTGQLAYELHGLTRGVAEAQHAEARRNIGGELLFPASLHLRLDGLCFERLDAGHALDKKRLVLSAALEFLIETSPEHRRRP